MRQPLWANRERHLLQNSVTYVLPDADGPGEGLSTAGDLVAANSPEKPDEDERL